MKIKHTNFISWWFKIFLNFSGEPGLIGEPGRQGLHGFPGPKGKIILLIQIIIPLHYIFNYIWSAVQFVKTVLKNMDIILGDIGPPGVEGPKGFPGYRGSPGKYE